MVIERFRPGKVKEIYERFDNKGRMLPEGVSYLNSWTDKNLKTCYQVMESESLQKLMEWTAMWDDLVDFEIIRVYSSQEAKSKALG